MEKAIYKIENKINHKIYIGQSVNPKARFRQHCNPNREKKGRSLIANAIKKYGEENFSLEILGWYEDYNEKEKEFIKQYGSLAPNGYNILPGGEEPPIHPNRKISEETAKNIQKELMDWNIRRRQIIKKYKITEDILRHINDGTSWKRDDLTYPLRPKEKELDNLRAEKVIKLLQTTNLSQTEIGKIVGWNRSAVTMINIGHNHHKDNLKYPIRQ